MKADTWDPPTSGQVLNRCDYNFQAFETNMTAVSLSGVQRLALEATVAVRDDSSMLFTGVNATDGTGCSNFIETGSNPWMHLILGGVFHSVSTPTRYYFVELVPFWQSGTLTGSYGDFSDFPGNDKPFNNNFPAQYDSSDPSHTGGGIGGSETPAYQLNARVATSDERVRPYLVLPGRMAIGEKRPIYIDMLSAFSVLYPGVSISDLIFDGAYIGTEQYNKGRIGFDITRFSVIAQ
jgi:hypothetical protein